MKIPIGIDIDGCLNSHYEELVKYVEKIFNLKVDNSCYSMLNSLNLPLQQENDFWLKFDLEILKANPEKNCVQVLNDIAQKYYIYIITARLYQSAKTTEKWLSDHKVPHNSLYLNAGNKLDICLWKNVRIMIEDNPENAIILAKNDIKVLLFDRPYNKDIFHNNIIRCKSWNQIKKEITNL